MALQRILSVTLCLAFLSACTKENPMDYLNKSDAKNKPLVSLTEEYLYSSAMQNASRTSSDALPFSSGDNKRVKLQWTETSLQIMETEKDARFKANKANDKLVLEIPVEHVDYKCDSDKYGECTNTEVEDTDKNWDQKNSFKVKLAEAKSGGLDLLPIAISQTVGEDCYNEISSQVLGFEITDTALNFQIRRNYTKKVNCMGLYEEVGDASVTGVFHYSLVKVNTVLSKDFKTITYPKLDENTFGFFSTEKKVLEIDNNTTEAGKTLIMNHWNPDRSEIVYYLSDEFNKPENQMVKDLTKQTVESLNQSLAQTGVKFRINLKEPAGKIPGDIRNSMIVLVEDPVAARVIGYGPQTEDPVTGEIISARTIMFLGTIKKTIKSTYEKILHAKKQDLLKVLADAKAKEEPTPDVAEENGGLVIEEGVLGGQARKKNLSGFTIGGMLKTKSEKIKSSYAQKISKIKKPKGVYTQPISSIVKNQIVRDFTKGATENVNREFISMDRKNQLKYMLESKNCAFSPSEAMIGTGISPALKNKFAANAKHWEFLTESEKQAVIDIILPEVWVPTLIHELGHNLGLRHNFQASEDKLNYFSNSELGQLKIDHQLPFSSVMDYGNDLQALPVLGKYDVAALKFGYLRTVETTEGNVIPVPESLNQLAATNKNLALKEYGYCTDEHTGVNAGCKRFDEGSSNLEITTNLIRDYYNDYTLRNFRRGKENMSLYDDPTYAARINSTFSDIRSMFETYERLKYRFQIPNDSPVWEEIDFLKDIKQATILGGQFFAQVLLTPDVKCAVVSDKNPSEIIGLYSLSFLGESEAMSCDKVELNPGFTVVGQGGKFINSKKDPDSENAYMDQIDVRGIWIDKMLAAKSLFNRQTGNSSFDKESDNYMDIPELQNLLVKTVLTLEMNEVSGPVELTLTTGEKIEVEAPYDVLEDHVIDKPIHPVIAEYLGVPYKERYLQETIGKIVAKEMVNGLGRESTGAAFSEALKVTRFEKPFVPSDGQTLKDLLNIDLGADVFYASQDNILATQAIQGIQISTLLGGIPEQKLAEIIKAREAGATEAPVDPTGDADAAALVRPAWKLPLDTVKQFAAGLIQSPENLEAILRYLPGNN